MVYSRLSRRLRDTGHTSFHDYLGWLENHDGPEWQEFVNALTTNLTAFFREQHHFEIFASYLRSKPSTNWRVWCNAASTGEEPYSIVITALEALGAVLRLGNGLDGRMSPRQVSDSLPAHRPAWYTLGESVL